MTELGGYVGRILFVDLSTGELGTERPDEALLRAFIGGYGLGARILYERMVPGADPLGPENLLGFVTGPLTGTPAVMASRYCVVAKSPLTGGWGDANSGGSFGPALKFAGYDAVFVHGASPAPVYLWIENGHAELRPAHELWGLDAVQVDEHLRARHGDHTRAACIGPAGERLARIACVINDRGRAAGRSGLGAVMGAKRLKAVAVCGEKQPPVAHPKKVEALRTQYLPLFKTNPEAEVMRRFGTPGYTQGLLSVGRTPIRNWAGSYPADYPNAEAVDGPAVIAYEQKKYACWHCVQVCGGIMRWDSGGKTYEGHKPEYETLATFGTYCGIDDLAAIMDMNEMCNRAGLDTISAGATVAFAMECAERGLFDPQELGGLELMWGDAAAAITLLGRMVDRQGIGDLFADGVQRAAQRLGRGSEEFAMHAGGQELPAHDPRQLADFGLAYQLSPTPGRHTQGGVGAVYLPDEVLLALGLDVAKRDAAPTEFHAQAYKALNGWRNVQQAAGLCAFADGIMPHAYVPEFLAAVTGWNVDMAEVLATGERIEMMRHVFSLREGYNPLRTQVAARAMGNPPLQAGPNAGVTVDIAALRQAYLEAMAWDPETAVPRRERVVALGLEDPAS